MRTYLKHIILFLILALPWNFMAQTSLEGLSYSSLKKMANQYEFHGDAYTSIDVLEKIMTLKPSDYESSLKLAGLYEGIRDYESALKLYQRIHKNGGDDFARVQYNVGLCEYRLEDYEQALATLKSFKKVYKGEDAVDLKKKIKVFEKGALAAIAGKKNPVNASVLPVTESINKPYTEFSPIMVGDTGLIYASLKAQEFISYEVANPPAYLPKARFYKAEWKNDEWVVRGRLKGPFNDPTMDVGNGAFSLDGQRFYFTKCALNDANKMICKLYYSNIDSTGENWTNPEPLPEFINLDGYTTTHPTVGRDLKSNNEILYFVSDRPEGEGGKDIWFSMFNPQMKVYEQPVNCGRKVNSEGDESTPFIERATSTLYFSSEGKGGYGGFDVFKSQGVFAKWTKPENLGYPINSGMDDLYYVLNESNNAGFLVSNRDGAVALKHKNCCDDIFSFTYPDMLEFEVEGDVIDTNGSPLKNAIMSLYLFGENNEEILVNRQKIGDDGHYKFALLNDKDYKLQVYKEGYLNNSIKISTKGYTYSKTFTKNIELKKISYESMVIKNIYYKYDDSRLQELAISEINKVLLPLLLENTHIIVEIGSHTDYKGSDAYNNKLSQQRAQSVVDYLVSQGIDIKRIKAKGYGECCPIALNENEDGSDNPEGRAKNRRTEFRILGEIPGFTKLLYSE